MRKLRKIVSSGLQVAVGSTLFASSLTGSVWAATYTESVNGEISANRLAPTFFQLDYQPAGNVPGSNVITGSVGRNASGVIERDYLWVNVPTGYRLSELRVGNQTTVGGSGSFIGLASGSSMPVAEDAADATGLMGYRVYETGDRGTDILDDMAIATNGSSGFSRPLGAGDYTLWIQELSRGTFTYRFNLVLSPVPEPDTGRLMAAGAGVLAATTWRRRRKGKLAKASRSR